MGIPQVKLLDEQLEAGKNVQMIHYPWVFEKKLLDRTVLSIQKNGLSTRQSYCIADDCTEEAIITEQCHVAALVRASSFPSYLLINQQCKILFRSDRKGLDNLILKLKALGLY